MISSEKANTQGKKDCKLNVDTPTTLKNCKN